MSMPYLKMMNTVQCVLLSKKRKNPASHRRERDLLNESMASVVLLVKLVKQKGAGIEFDPAQQRVTPIALDLQKSRNVKTPLVQIRSLGKNGNVRGVNRYHETPI